MIFAALAECRMVDPGTTPFAMKPIPEFVFPVREFSVADYGATCDGSKCTEAFAKAIAACHAAGGGRVVVPPGVWFTGPIHFRSNVELHLEKGATLDFSDDPKDYLPAVRSSWEGLECMNYSPLVYACCCTNVAITGEGSLRPRMKGWGRFFKEVGTNIQEARAKLYTWGATDFPVEQRVMPAASTAIMRPQLIQMNRSVNVRLEGIEIRDSPFWTVHFYQSENVIVRKVRMFAYGFNNDGFDIEMTQNVLIEDCDISAGDDGFVLKSGRNRDAWRINRPTQNVVVRNCFLRNATALVAVGSELSGGIRNVYVHDCKVGTVARVFYIKTNHRRGGYVDTVVVENIAVDSTIKLMAVETDVLYQWAVFPDYENRLTRIANLTLANVDCQASRQGIEINGDPRLPVSGVTFRNVRIGTLQQFLSKIENAEGVRSENLVAEKLGQVTNPWDEAMPLMPEPTVKGAAKPLFESDWKGKKVAFIGGPCVDWEHVDGATKYWGHLSKMLGLDAYAYGVGGSCLDGALTQAKRVMLDFHWYVDALVIWVGDNDFNCNVPRGEWHVAVEDLMPQITGTVNSPRRGLSMDQSTFRGRLNRLLAYVKHNFPDQQIVLCTSLHRGFAQLNEKGILPGEDIPNQLGLYIEDYNDDVRRAGHLWSVPVLDLYERSGLLPTDSSYVRYFTHTENGFVQPNEIGHERVARTMAFWLLTIPANFKRRDGLFDM